MKFAFTIFRYFAFGGLQKDFERTVAECVRRGHEVIVCAMEWENDRPLAGTQLKIFPPRGVTNHARAENFEKDVSDALKKNPCDCVVGFNLMRGCDYLFIGDECLARTKKSRHSSVILHLLPRYRALLKKEADICGENNKTKFLLISENQIADYQFFYNLPRERAFLLPPALNPLCGNIENEEETRLSVRRKLGIADDEFALAIVGSDFTRKGSIESLRAIKALPLGIAAKTKLFLVGQSKIKKTLACVNELKLNDKVTFLGGREDVPELLCGIDCLLHAAREECGGSVLLEALVSGVPVICSQICGFSKYVKDALSPEFVLPRNFKQYEYNCLLSRTLFNLAAVKNSINRKVLKETHCNNSRAKMLVDILERHG